MRKDKDTNELILKITDFGLSRSYEIENSNEFKMTSVGTPLYMVIIFFLFYIFEIFFLFLFVFYFFNFQSKKKAPEGKNII